MPELLKSENGLILVTGATGSGKSTTLAAMVGYLNQHADAHILTLEDPVEYLYASQRCLIQQREIGLHCMTFASGLRAALREDPDVILLGELRDSETIRLALTAAETGHLDCQIAPYDYGIITEKGKEVINSAYLREAQAKVEHRVANSGMAVLLDAGMEKGIHPAKKQIAGERLALLALTKTYGVEGVNGESPYYKSIEIKNDTVVVSFERANMWISGKNCFESKNFQVAGEDKVFYPAKAWIERSKMLVKSDKVPHPVAVRYCFENYVEGDVYCDGLPLGSFRSDDW